MDITQIAYPVIAISGMGLALGIGLGYAGKIFAVPVDERVGLIRDALPGANCGGCGFAGCDALAAAIAAGEAKPNACPVGGQAAAEAIAAVMGVEAGTVAKSTAFVKCAGCDSMALNRYNYEGLQDCRAVQMLAAGGAKACKYGCLGSGSCVRACQFGAISVVDGVAVVDKAKCTACGMCAAACPRGLIDIVPEANAVRVVCNSKDPGKVVREICKAGCIACKLCTRACGFDAIHVNENLARVAYDKCTNCGACAAKCPAKVIAGGAVAAAEETAVKE